MLEAEAISWKQVKPTLVFLVERDSPSVDPNAAAAYEAFSRGIDQRLDVRCLNNSRDLAESIAEAVGGIESVLRPVSGPSRQTPRSERDAQSPRPTATGWWATDCFESATSCTSTWRSCLLRPPPCTTARPPFRWRASVFAENLGFQLAAGSLASLRCRNMCHSPTRGREPSASRIRDRAKPQASGSQVKPTLVFLVERDSPSVDPNAAAACVLARYRQRLDVRCLNNSRDLAESIAEAVGGIESVLRPVSGPSRQTPRSEPKVRGYRCFFLGPVPQSRHKCMTVLAFCFRTPGGFLSPVFRRRRHPHLRSDTPEAQVHERLPGIRPGQPILDPPCHLRR